MNQTRWAVTHLLPMLVTALSVPLAAQQLANEHLANSEQWIANPHTAATSPRWAFAGMATASALAERLSSRCATRWTSANAVTFLQGPTQRHSKWVTGLAIGFVGGALLGGAIGFAADVEGNDAPPEQLAAVGAGIGALSGAVIGTIIGASIHVERSARPPASGLRFTPFPQIQASLRVAFSF